MTGSELVAVVRNLLDEPSTSLLSDDELLTYANLALPLVAIKVVEAGNPYYKQSAVLTYDSTNENYPLPSDAWVVDDVVYEQNGVKVVLTPAHEGSWTTDSMHITYGAGCPTWELRGNAIYLRPNVEDANLTVYYHRKPTTITASEDIDLPDILNRLLALETALYAAVKAGYSTGELQTMKLLEEKGLKAALGLNANNKIKIVRRL